MITTEKPGTPEELLHYGVKGMKWGVRKERSASDQARSARRKATAKKVAIGVGVTAVVLGSAYVAYKLSSNSSAPTGIARSLAARQAQIDLGKKHVGQLTEAQWNHKIKMQRSTTDLMSRVSQREAAVGRSARRAKRGPVDWSKAYIDWDTSEIKFHS